MPTKDSSKVDCPTCGGTGEKAILVCTYGHAVVWGGAPEVSWEGESCNYLFICGADLHDSGQVAPCPDCSEDEGDFDPTDDSLDQDEGTMLGIAR